MNGAIPPPPLAERILRAYTLRFPIHRGKSRIVEALWKQAAGASGTARIADLETGHQIVCDIAQQLQRQYYYFGTYWLERTELACWRAIARESETVFDVGANLGIYTLNACAANPSSVVHAFEPTPAHAAHLRRTLEANGIESTHVHEMAIGDKSGEAFLNLWAGGQNDNEGMNFITSAPRSVETLSVRVRSLDDFCQTNDIDHIDLMKMDVQGNERAVLDGATRLLAERRLRTLFVELNWDPDPDQPCTASEVVEVLAANGFKFSKPHWPLRFQAPGPWLRNCSDVVAQVSTVLGPLEA